MLGLLLLSNYNRAVKLKLNTIDTVAGKG